MKIITVPADIEVEYTSPRGRVKDKSVFKKFLVDAIDLYAEGIKGPKRIRLAAKVVDVIENSNGTITLEDDHYDLVKGAVEHMDWMPGYARQVIPFFDAVENAEAVKAQA